MPPAPWRWPSPLFPSRAAPGDLQVSGPVQERVGGGCPLCREPAPRGVVRDLHPRALPPAVSAGCGPPGGGVAQGPSQHSWQGLGESLIGPGSVPRWQVKTPRLGQTRVAGQPGVTCCPHLWVARSLSELRRPLLGERTTLPARVVVLAWGGTTARWEHDARSKVVRVEWGRGQPAAGAFKQMSLGSGAAQGHLESV